MLKILKEILILCTNLSFCRYFAYLATILIICYIQKDSNSYRQKTGLETAVVHGGLMCEVVADDEPGYVECGDMDMPQINFMKASSFLKKYKIDTQSFIACKISLGHLILLSGTRCK